MVNLARKYVHSLGQLQMLGGLTDGALVDRLTVGRSTGRRIDKLKFSLG